MSQDTVLRKTRGHTEAIRAIDETSSRVTESRRAIITTPAAQQCVGADGTEVIYDSRLSAAGQECCVASIVVGGSTFIVLVRV
jgi:hypothetical protein